MVSLNGLSRTRITFAIPILFIIIFFCQDALGVSTITGTVYDKQRNVLSQIEVELLNDYHQMVSRTQTDGVGRYQFTGLRDGRYTVKVYAFRYDLEDQEIPVEINTQNIRGGEGSGYFIQDFYLLPKKGGLREAELGVIFAQEVPKEAKSAYERAVEDFSKKREEEGFANLKKSLEIFPTYYLALHRFGLELFSRKQYLESAQVFMEAVQVNDKSATSFYYLGNSLYHLGKDYYKAAYRALNHAYILAPASPQVLWLLGTIERSTGNFSEAEKHLLQAKKLSVNKVPEIHKELAQLYANDLKKYNEAADELELYLKASNPSDADEKQTKKIISDLRAKARSKSN